MPPQAELTCRRGFLYLAGVLDVFSRRLVGWSMSDRMTTPLVLSALETGLFRRDVQRGQLTHQPTTAAHLPDIVVPDDHGRLGR